MFISVIIFFKLIAIIVTDKEISTLFVMIVFNPFSIRSSAALKGHLFTLALFLAGDGCELEITNSQIRFDAEQAAAFAAKGHKTGSRKRQGNVTRLDGLDDLILIAFVFQADIVVKIKGAFAVLINPDGHFFTNMSLHPELLGLFHFEIIVRPPGHGCFHLAAFLVAKSSFNANVSGHVKAYFATAKNLLKSLAFNFHRNINS